MQNNAKRRVVRGLHGSLDGKVMLLARHVGGFSVDASVCIADDNRSGLELLLQGY